jgi:hypothetical protein
MNACARQDWKERRRRDRAAWRHDDFAAVIPRFTAAVYFKDPVFRPAPLFRAKASDKLIQVSTQARIKP